MSWIELFDLAKRLFRDAFQAVEFNEDSDQIRERAHDLGESILMPMVETIQDVHNEKTVGEHHVIRGEPEVVNALLEHLREQSLTLEIQSDYYENGDYVVEFVKVANSTQDRIRHYLGGEESE